VTILSVTPARWPAAARFELDRPLEDPEYLWLVWNGKEYTAFTPPARGGTEFVLGTHPLRVWLGKNHPITRLYDRLHAWRGSAN
jgi:hypothetical protein